MSTSQKNMMKVSSRALSHSIKMVYEIVRGQKMEAHNL